MARGLPKDLIKTTKELDFGRQESPYVDIRDIHKLWKGKNRVIVVTFVFIIIFLLKPSMMCSLSFKVRTSIADVTIWSVLSLCNDKSHSSGCYRSSTGESVLENMEQ
jgi:hypothetical protein